MIFRKLAAVLLACALMISLVPPVAAEPTASPGTSPNVSASGDPAASTEPTATLPPPPPTLNPESITAASAILFDMNTGKILFEKDAYSKRYPASITKIMTGLLAEENIPDMSIELTMTNAVYEIETGSSHISLKPGEILTAEQVFYGMFLESGNDAANALGDYISGSLSSFIAKMNERAKELGMSDSNFMNTHGLPHQEHYVTASDMMKLVIECNKHPRLMKAVSTVSYNIPPTNLTNETRYLTNGNGLIKPNHQYYYQYATGMKTGYTIAAQHTFVGTARRDGMELGVVLLKDTRDGKWIDSTVLFEYGFANYRTTDLRETINRVPLQAQLPNAAADDPMGGLLEFKIIAEEPEYLTDSTSKINAILESIDRIKVVTEPDINTLQAPIEAGTQLKASFLLDGVLLMECPISATRSVQSGRNTTILPPDGSNPGGRRSALVVVAWVVFSIVAFFLLLRVTLRVIINVRQYKRRKLHMRRSSISYSPRKDFRPPSRAPTGRYRRR